MSNIWYHEDDAGRKIGYMYPETFQAILVGHYGEKSYVKAFSEEFGITTPTIYRYLHGTLAIKKDLAMTVLMLAQLSNNNMELPEVHADWLPTIAYAPRKSRAKPAEAPEGAQTEA